MNALLRPPLKDIYEFLDSQQALIVHFSGAPKGIGADRGRLFPEDLLAVLDGAGAEGLSCSAVRPGDIFSGLTRNAIGCIGLILKPRSPQSLVGVGPSDLGSEEVDGVRRAPSQHITVEVLRESFDSRKNYNEWVVRDFDVAGLFAAQPFEVWRYNGTSPDGSKNSGPSHSSLAELRARFPELPIFSLNATSIFQVSSSLAE